ncbi:MAG: tyrosine-type recombinase/integrase [Candidatus Saccharimonadales bacterium]
MNSLVPIGEDYRQTDVKQIFDVLDVSEATRADYQARIGMFLAFVKHHGLDRNSFLDFKRMLADRIDLSVSTKNKYLAVARIFLKELNRQGVLPADITQNIKAFRQSKKHKKDGVSDEEMAVIAQSLHNLSPTLEALRIKAIISLLALQGLRQIELVRLNVSDLELYRGVAFVQGKGRDDTEPIHLHQQTIKALKDYIAANHLADGALFTSNSNNSLHRRITTRSIRQIVQDYLAAIGVDNRNVHGFRHYFTTRLIKIYKSDLTEVARYTRHRSLETLQTYNDAISMQADLPRFHSAFEQVQI